MSKRDDDLPAAAAMLREAGWAVTPPPDTLEAHHARKHPRRRRQAVIKQAEAEHAIAEWREAYEAEKGRLPVLAASYEQGWIRFKCPGLPRYAMRVSRLKEITERLRALTAARASETDKQQAQS